MVVTGVVRQAAALFLAILLVGCSTQPSITHPAKEIPLSGELTTVTNQPKPTEGDTIVPGKSFTGEGFVPIGSDIYPGELPKLDPTVVMRQIGGLGTVTAYFGSSLLDALANLDENDHLILSNPSSSAAKDYLAASIHAKYSEERDLRGTDFLKQLDKLYTKKPAKRAYVTVVTNQPEDFPADSAWSFSPRDTVTSCESQVPSFQRFRWRCENHCRFRGGF